MDVPSRRFMGRTLLMHSSPTPTSWWQASRSLKPTVLCLIRTLPPRFKVRFSWSGRTKLFKTVASTMPWLRRPRRMSSSFCLMTSFVSVFWKARAGPPRFDFGPGQGPGWGHEWVWPGPGRSGWSQEFRTRDCSSQCRCSHTQTSVVLPLLLEMVLLPRNRQKELVIDLINARLQPLYIGA